MSLLIGKDSNGSNVVHITGDTRSKETLKHGPIASTVFHSSRELLVVTGVTTFTPNFDDTAYFGNDGFPAETISYDRSSGASLNLSKPILTLCKFNTNQGVLYSLGTFAPLNHMVKYNSESIANYISYVVSDILPDKLQVFTGSDIISTDTTLEATDTYHGRLPSEIIVYQLGNDITNVRSTELNGAIDINRDVGIKVGNTKYFNNRYIALLDTHHSDVDNVSKPMVFSHANGDNQPYNTYKYLHLSAAIDSEHYEMDFSSSSIVSNGHTLVSPDFSYLRYTDVQSIDITSKDDSMYYYLGNVTTGSTLGSKSVRYGWKHRTGLKLDNLPNLNDNSVLFLYLRLTMTNSPDDSPRYRTINGIFKYNDIYDCSQEDEKIFEASAAFTKVDDTYMFTFSFNDTYFDGSIWNTDGNHTESSGNIQHIESITGWIANIEARGLTNVSEPFTYHLIDTSGSDGISASDSYSDTRSSEDAESGLEFSQDGDVFTSGNAGIPTSFTSVQLSIDSGSGFINWDVDGESGADMLRIWVNQELKVKSPLGSTSSIQSGNLLVTSGDTVYAAYSKDDSDDYGEDKAVLTVNVG